MRLAIEIFLFSLLLLWTLIVACIGIYYPPNDTGEDD